MSRIEHLLILLPWLKRNQGVTVEEAAAHFKLTEKQLVQDLMLLSVSGVGQFPGEQFDISYVDGEIYVRDSLGIDRPVRFDSMEAACLLLGLELLELLPQAMDEFTREDIQSVQNKINSVIADVPRIAIVEGSKTPHQDTLDAVEVALSSNKQLLIQYWNDSRDDVTQRLISPHATRLDEDTIVLDAWCHESGAWRSFRVERIREIAVQASDVPSLPTSFKPMPVQTVTVEVDASDQHLLEVLTWAGPASYSGSVVSVDAYVAQPQWLARKVIASGGRLRVLQPAEFKSAVQEFVAQAQAAYL